MDNLAKVYHKENVKETEHSRQLKAKEERAMKFVKEIIAASTKRIDMLKQGKLSQEKCKH